MYVGPPGIGEFVIVFSLLGGFGLPLGIPPAEEDPLMYKVAPEECLFYTTWAGMAAPDPNSTNQTEQLLAEPEVQHLIAELERRVREGVRKVAEEEGPEAAALAEQLIGWGKTALTSPAAIFVEDVKIDPGGPPEIRAGALVRVGEQGAAIKAKLVEYQTAFLREAVTPVEIAGDTWYRIQPPEPGAPSITWGVRFSYLIVGVGDGSVEGIMERARTEMPEWLGRVRGQIPVPRTSTLTYLNVAKIVDMARPFLPPQGGAIVEALGLGNVTALSSVTGLDDEGFVSRILLGIEGEPGGIFELVSDKPLTAEELAAIPADSTVALAARLDADAIFETILSVAEKIEPRAREQVETGLGQMQQALGIDLRADVLKALGDTWCIYNSPGEGGLVITGLTAVVKLRDAERFAATHEKLLAMARGMLSQQRGPRGGPQIREVEFAGQTIYVLDAGEEEFPLAPSWCLTEEQLVAAPFPQNVKAYLSRGAEHRSLAEVPQVAGLFADGPGPVVLTYYDTKALFKLFYPMVPMMAQAISTQLKRGGIDFDVSLIPSAGAIGPHLLPGVGAVRRTPAGIEMLSRQTLPGGNVVATAPVSVAILLPAVQSARGAARRAASTNNMRQIMIALHNYHQVHGKFPPAYATDENGNPTVSWRVLILPFLEQQPLYEKFKLDEPWDSPNNKQWSATIVPTYHSPGSRTEMGMTNYLGVFGEDAIFTGKDGTPIADIRDGTSNTIAVVEVADEEAVPWAKPADYEYDPDDPMAGLGGLWPGGFIVALADGSVRFIHEGIDPEVLKRLFSRNDNMPVPWDRIEDRPRGPRPPRPIPRTFDEDISDAPAVAPARN